MEYQSDVDESGFRVTPVYTKCECVGSGGVADSLCPECRGLGQVAEPSYEYSAINSDLDDPFDDAHNPDEDRFAADGTEGVDRLTYEEDVLLDEYGLTRHRQWVPETLEQVDWVLYKAKQMDREIADIQEHAAEKVGRIEKAKQLFLSRYLVPCEQVVAAALPRGRNGQVTRKSLVMDRVKVKFTASQGGPKVTSEASVLDWIVEHGRAGKRVDALEKSVRVEKTDTLTGREAINEWMLQNDVSDYKLKILHDPVKKYVASLKPSCDENGVVIPATIPGVVIVEPSEKFSFE